VRGARRVESAASLAMPYRVNSATDHGCYALPSFDGAAAVLPTTAGSQDSRHGICRLTQKFGHRNLPFELRAAYDAKRPGGPTVAFKVRLVCPGRRLRLAIKRWSLREGKSTPGGGRCYLSSGPVGIMQESQLTDPRARSRRP